MAYTITVEQVARSYNSITMNVSGMLEGDRQTFVLVSPDVRGDTSTDEWEWYTLQTAKANGYISDFYVTDLGNNNGDIEVTIPYQYAKTHKVWRFCVRNLVDGAVKADVVINTILGFEYDYTETKVTGEVIDITRNDMLQTNLFGTQIGSWAADLYTYYYADSDMGYTEIDYDYLLLPAQNILNGAKTLYTAGVLADYLFVYGYIYSTTQNVKSREPFKAQYFNGVKDAINNFNMKVSAKV